MPDRPPLSVHRPLFDGLSQAWEHFVLVLLLRALAVTTLAFIASIVLFAR